MKDNVVSYILGMQDKLASMSSLVAENLHRAQNQQMLYNGNACQLVPWQNAVRHITAIHYAIRIIPILGNAVWSEKCSSKIPTIHGYCPAECAEILGGAHR